VGNHRWAGWAKS